MVGTIANFNRINTFLRYIRTLAIKSEFLEIGNQTEWRSILSMSTIIMKKKEIIVDQISLNGTE